MIRKITRGISVGGDSENPNVTITCSITDTSKVIVILNGLVARTSAGNSFSNSLYLISVSKTNVIIYYPFIDSFSYQIIEFM